MDPRIAKHADVVVDWSAGVKAGDHVMIMPERGTESLAQAIAVAVGKRGGHPLIVDWSFETIRAVTKAQPVKTVAKEPKHLRALVDACDVFVFIEGGTNTRTLVDVPKAKVVARAQALAQIREVRLQKRWVLTIHPTDGLAQDAGMPTDAFADLVYGMTLVDWKAFSRELRKVSTRLAKAKEIRLIGKDTDLILPVQGRVWVPSNAKNNLPSGEIFTSPIETKVEGHAYLDLPAIVQGDEVRGLRLVFEGGEIVDWSAEAGGKAVKTLLDTDAGARRLGELGIGMNRGLTKPTKNILLDEKMGGTIHLAVGRAYKESKGRNESMVHQDFIKTMGPGSRILADGKAVQVDGRFWYEKGFKAPKA